MTRCDIAKTVRRALVLLGGSALCVLILICAFTDVGAHTIFRLGVRMTAEPVDITDTAYLEYYDVKRQLADTNSVRVWLGTDAAAGYDAALDFLKFVKQNLDLTVVRMNVPDADMANQYLSSGDANLLPQTGFDAAGQSFLRMIYIYNQKLPPQKRVTIVNETDAPGTGEFILSAAVYNPAVSAAGVLDVSMIYPGEEGCDPLFDVQAEGLRFGTLTRLAACTSILEAVSGNLGHTPFTGLAQPEFYFLVGRE